MRSDWPGLPSPHVAVACALIVRDGHLLAAQRPAGKPLAGEWEFPGGKIEAAETPEQAVVREIEEELRIRVAVMHSLPVSHYSYPHLDVTLHPFVCQVANTEQRQPQATEHAQLRWVTKREALGLSWLAADYPVLHTFFANPDYGVT